MTALCVIEVEKPVTWLVPSEASNLTAWTCLPPWGRAWKQSASTVKLEPGAIT